MSSTAEHAHAPSPEPGATAVLIGVVASIATALGVFTWHSALLAADARPLDVAVFFVLTAALMLLAVDLYGRGSISVSGVILLATGFTFGVGPALFAGIFAAVVHALKRRSLPHKALFNAATFGLAAATGAEIYRLFPHASSPLVELIPAIAAGTAFWIVNIGLLTTVMALSQGLTLRRVFEDRFRWLTPHYLAFGPLALACTLAYEKIGLIGLFAFALPPVLLIVSVQQYLRKTRASVAEIERANDDLSRANDELSRSNADLRDLFEFAAGLAAQTHDSRSLALYAKTSLERLLGARVELAVGDDSATANGALCSAGRVVGGLSVEGGNSERWARLRDVIEPQLATALESTTLAEEVRRTHLETIAALSRSMEAKDSYTGGHTERVSEVAVALARRLGYEGAELDAIEIGALLHDIGKIGIPESILQKPGPLDDEEWLVMKRHPVIGERILSEIAISPLVLQIARSSHERIDGSGYPDGLAGDAIPLPARIVLVADAFDALTSNRPYRSARRPQAALEEINAHSGSQFCPSVVAALADLFAEEPEVVGATALTLVVATETARDAASSSTEMNRSPVGAQPADGVSVLLVDDDAAELHGLATILEPLGAELLLASSGGEALRVLDSHDVAAVLLDVDMPGMDGFETARLINERHPERHLPIVLLASEIDSEDVQHGSALGIVDYQPRPLDPELLRHKVSVFVELAGLRERARVLSHHALHDPLTGLPNRTLFLDRLQVALQGLRAGSPLVAVLFIDLDGLQAINEVAGHQAGDRVLAETGARLRSMIRATDTAARFGGDEFLVVCDQVSDESEIDQIRKRLAAAIEEPIVYAGEILRVRAAIGCVSTNDASVTPEAMISGADRDMLRERDIAPASAASGLGRSAELRLRPVHLN